jgi:predicted deacylase
MVGYHPTHDATEAVSKSLALAFGIDNVWRIPPSPTSTRTFNGSIARSGIPTIGTEVRGLGGLREDDVTPLKQGLQNVLIQRGMLSGSVPDSSRTISSTQTLTFSSTGLFRIQVDLGESIRVGQPLGRVVSIEGDLLETITSRFEGQVWAVRRFASVHPGDIAFQIGQAE